MQKLFWVSGIGMVAVAGLVYLTASSVRKSEVRTLGHKPPAAAAEGLSDRLHGLAAFGAHSCIQGQHQECQEEASPLMPLQIIDVCQPYPLSMIAPAEEGLIPVGAEEPAPVEDAEELPMPQEEPAEEIAMPRCGDSEEPQEAAFPIPFDEEQPEPLPMPSADDEPKTEEPMAEDDDGLVDFWMSFFKDMLPADDENTDPAEENCDPAEEGPMDEVQEPGCQEDPHHSEYYPSCPYMGGCPRTTPPCPAGGSSKVKKPKHGHDDVEPCEPCPKAEPDPESPAQPGVDTMEFRPSDAKEGEFEPKPM